jgi:hypothetical protein
MATLHDFIEVCNAFNNNSCDDEGVFNIEKYRDCVMMLDEPEFNEKARYFIDYVGPYVYCKDSNIFFIPTPGTKIFSEVCEQIFNTGNIARVSAGVTNTVGVSGEREFSIPVVSGEVSDLSDFNNMLDEDETFKAQLEAENKMHIIELFNQVMLGVAYPKKSFDETLEMCIRQCSEMNLGDEYTDKLVALRTSVTSECNE